MTDPAPPGLEFSLDLPSKKSRLKAPERLSSGDARKRGGELMQRRISASADCTRAHRSPSSPMSGWYVGLRNPVIAHRNCVLALALYTSCGKNQSSKQRRRSIQMEYRFVETRKRQSSRVAGKTASFARGKSTLGSIAFFMTFHANLRIL